MVGYRQVGSAEVEVDLAEEQGSEVSRVSRQLVALVEGLSAQMSGERAG